MPSHGVRGVPGTPRASATFSYKGFVFNPSAVFAYIWLHRQFVGHGSSVGQLGSYQRSTKSGNSGTTIAHHSTHLEKRSTSLAPLRLQGSPERSLQPLCRHFEHSAVFWLSLIDSNFCSAQIGFVHGHARRISIYIYIYIYTSADPCISLRGAKTSRVRKHKKTLF